MTVYFPTENTDGSNAPSIMKVGSIPTRTTKLSDPAPSEPTIAVTTSEIFLGSKPIIHI